MRWLRERLGRIDPALAIVVVAFAAVQLAYLDYSPIWDTTAYAECLHDAVETHAFLTGLNCFKHPSAGYLIFPALAQLVFFGSFAATHVVNVLLGSAALVSFHALLETLLPGAERRRERILGTALLAAMPVVNGNLLNWTPDFGAYAFFVLFLSNLMRGRKFAAISFGLLLTFSKESGALMYAVTLACFVIACVPVREWKRRALPALPFLLPPLAMAAFLLHGSHESHGSGLWRGMSLVDIAGAFLSLSFDRHLLAYAVGVFVISFDWIPTVLMLVALAISLPRIRQGFPRERLFLGLLLAAGFYALTRVQTFSHLRYVLVLYPVFVALFVVAVDSLFHVPRIRLAALAAVLVLFAISDFRTLDPVSRATYGTWKFGDHPMLRVTGITGECCGYGLDGLTYNLEFAQVHYLVDEAIRDLAPTQRDVFAMAEHARAWIVWRLDSTTFARTLERTGSYAPAHFGVEVTPHLPDDRERILFLEVPTADPARARSRLRQRYGPGERRSYDRHGYRLEVEIFRGAPSASTR